MKAPFEPELCPDDLEAALRWIHADVGPSDAELLVAEALQRYSAAGSVPSIALKPLVKWHASERVAGSYFKVLSGNVATLGGVRAAPGWEQAAVDMLVQQIESLKSLGLSQVQAIVRADDPATSQLVQCAGLRLLTEIEHLWLDVCAYASLASSAGGALAPRRSAGGLAESSSVAWRPAAGLDREALAEFINATFVATLDCPALNGRRTPAEVLDGFLDGRQMSDPSLQWDLLEVDQAIVGCLLVQTHESHLMELVYMGLLPAARGRGLGKAMVARAIHTAHCRACPNLVVAVDRDNWPARNVYLDWGFQAHQRLQVWLAGR